MADLSGAFVAAIGISLISLIGILTFTIKKERVARMLFFFVALAVGALLGNSFFHLLPHAYEELENPVLVGTCVLIGMLLLFLIERILHWHHAHNTNEEDCELGEHCHPETQLGVKVAVADGVHNFIDGIIIGIAFLQGPHIGLATTLAIILHEIPQEMSDAALLLHAGFSRTKALFVNFLSAFASVVGVLMVALFGTLFEFLVPYATALTAGAFIYIALEDLVPEIGKQKTQRGTWLFIGIAALGALLVGVFAGGSAH